MNNTQNNNTAIVRFAIKLSNTLNYIMSLPTQVSAFAKHVFTNKSNQNALDAIKLQIVEINDKLENLELEIGTVNDDTLTKDDADGVIQDKIDEINWEKRINFSELISDNEDDIISIINNNYDLDNAVDESRCIDLIEESFTESTFKDAVKKIIDDYGSRKIDTSTDVKELIRNDVYDVLDEIIETLRHAKTTRTEIRSDSSQ